MLQYLSKVFYLLGNDKRRLPFMVLLFIGSAMLDLIGLGLIGPYIALVVTPQTLDGKLGQVIELVGLPIEQKPLLLIFGMVLLFVFLLKAISMVYINYVIINFSLKLEVRLRSFLMQTYQFLPYNKYLHRNSSEFIYSIQYLSSQFSGSVVLSLLRFVSDAIVAIAILTLLAWSNILALTILVGLVGGFIICYDGLISHRLRESGELSNQASTTLVKGITEGIEGLKEIRILGREKYFYQVVNQNAIITNISLLL